MKLSFADLPLEVQEAYEASTVKPHEAQNLGKIGATAEIEGTAVVDNSKGVIYTTRDGGKSFEAERIAETIRFPGDHFRNQGLAVRRVIRISKLESGT